jgi:putative two-component system response regulator
VFRFWNKTQGIGSEASFRVILPTVDKWERQKTMISTGLAPDILIVDDNEMNVELLREILNSKGYRVRTALSGRLAIQFALTERPDLFLVDIQMPGMDGYQFCATVKAMRDLAEIPVIFISGLHATIDKVRAFSAGGVDYITKPFQADELRVRVDTHLELRRLNRKLQQHNMQLQELVQEQVKAIIDGHMATMFALAKLAESRDDDTGNHIRRVQTYCKILAIKLSSDAEFKKDIDESYIENLYHTAPLHDIGKVGIPDAILLKPGRLTTQEFEVMKTHTLIGAATLEQVVRIYPDNLFARMGATIARCHHELWDGSGYPEQLRGEAIPICARILAIADQYDALRNARPYKPAFDHRTACEIIIKGDGRTKPSHFDPRVLSSFKKVHEEFDAAFHNFCNAAEAIA